MKPISELDNLSWSAPKQVGSKGKFVKTAEPNEQFWDLYREHKIVLNEVGIIVNKWDNKWQVNWWQRDGVFVYPVLPETLPGFPLILDVEPLVNENKIKPFQKAPVQQVVAAMRHYNASLNGSPTGVGKTYMTLFAARERKRDVVVICPKSITPDWLRAGFDVGVNIRGAYGWEWIKTGKTPFGFWHTRTVNAGKKNEKEVRDTFEWTIPEGVDLIFDEIHRAAGMDTQNSHIVIKAREQGYPIYGLSATIANDPTKMNAIGYVLGLHKGGRDFYDWMGKNGVKEISIPRGRYRVTIYKFVGGARHLQNIHHSIFPNKGVRIRPEDLGDILPPSQIFAKSYMMDEQEDIQKTYAQMLSKVSDIELDSSMSKSEKNQNILVEILRARQKVELLKVPLFVSLTRDAIEEGNSVFIAVNFKETLKKLKEELKIKSYIMGGQKENDRRNMIDDFQNNKTDKIIGIIQACREGLNLQDLDGSHPRVSLIMPTPSANDLRQVLGRTPRVGAKSISNQYIPYAANTIEEDVCENVATKLDQLDLLMDGDLQKGIFPPSYSSMRPEETEEYAAAS